MQPTSTLPLVSVVTPVYNGEEYLRECIESVIAQTYTNWEYVILDNASTDGTRRIAEEYVARDSRIRLISNPELLPMVRNHNRALELASTDSVYCKMLMADDWLFPECLQRMVNAAQRHPSISLVCSYAFDGRHVMWDGFPYPAELVPGREAARQALCGVGRSYFLGSPTSMLMRTRDTRIRQPFFNESNLHCDFEACMELLAIGDFAFVHQVLSLNRVHEKSLSSQLNDKYETVRGNDVDMMARFGRKFLGDEEFSFHRQRTLYFYYRALARNLLLFRGPEFWRRQRKQFERMPVEFSAFAFLRALLAEIWDDIIRPGQFIKAAVNRWRSA